MLVNYPIDSAQNNNFVHDSIYEAITLIFSNLNNRIAVPNWPDILPQRYREKLKSRRSIRDLLVELKNIATPLTEAQRNAALVFINNENDIEGLLNGTTIPMVITNDIQPFIDCFKRIFIEGFKLLTKTGSRDAHYKAIYDSLISKTCPFCGYEPFEAPGLKREDEDHYLLKDNYVTSAANLFNLVPMGGKCNKSYKLQQDIIFKNNQRRKALNPYSNVQADISLLKTDPVALLDDKPDWKITIMPDIEETRTWYEVFSIETRLKENVLSPNYNAVLSEVRDFLKLMTLDHKSTNIQVLNGLSKFEAYKKNNPEQGLGFLKDKVVNMLKFYFELGNPLVVALIRDCLSNTQTEQVT